MIPKAENPKTGARVDSASSECLVHLFKMAPSTPCLPSVEGRRAGSRRMLCPTVEENVPTPSSPLLRPGYHP